MYQGDIRLGDTIDVKFTSRRFSSGAPYTLAGSPAVAAYEDNSATEITAGITLTVDFDSRTGLNNVRVVASNGNGYSAGKNYALVLTAGTVDSVTVEGEVVGSFSIANRSALMPATAGRTLVVDSAGLADANAVKLGPSGSGTAQTARDLGSSVLLSSGTGTGQLDFTSGVIKANLAQILGTALTETAGQIAAAFKKFFNIATPAATMDHLVLVDTATTLTNAPSDSSGVTMLLSRVSSARAGYLDNLNVGGNVASAADSTTLLSRLSSARAGYLDNLNVGGAVASSAEVSGLNVNTRATLLVPEQIETPDSSTQTYKVRLHLYDEVGNMEAPDSSPTVTLTNAAGTDRSSRLSSSSNPSTGVYTWDYTATAGDAEEQLIWIFTVTEASVARTYPANSYVVEQTSYRFSSSDRSNLNAIKTKTDQLAFTNTNKVDAALNAAGDLPQDCADKVWSTASRALTDKANFTLSTAGVQAIWDRATSALTTAGSIGKRIVDYLTGDIFARIGAPAGASIAADIAALPTASENGAAAVAATVEGAITVGKSLRLSNAALGGKCSGMATSTGTFRDVGDSKDRIVATVDADGNRSAVALDLS